MGFVSEVLSVCDVGGMVCLLQRRQLIVTLITSLLVCTEKQELKTGMVPAYLLTLSGLLFGVPARPPAPLRHSLAERFAGLGLSAFTQAGQWCLGQQDSVALH